MNNASSLRTGARLSALAVFVAQSLALPARAAVDYRDTLERAFDGPDMSVLATERSYDVYVSDQWQYDDNVFRLPSSTTDLNTLIGPGASRGDHINTATVGFDGNWTYGRQRIRVDLRLDDNRYLQNDDLNNVSSSDQAILDWGLGPALSGEAGVYYYRNLASFVNSNVYTRNVINTEGAYGTARYQVGPHWAVFAGALGSNTTLSADVSRVNNNSNAVFDFGTEYAWSPTNNIGLEYRFSDVSFPHEDVFFGAPGNGDYQDDIARFIFNYALSEKTVIVSNFGYLHREYTGSNIHGFGGDTWRISFRWQPTDKTNIALDGWRKLQAYLTEQSAYFVSTGVSIGPTIEFSEKVSAILFAGLEDQKYVGSGQPETALVTGTQGFVGERHDRVNSAQAEVLYNPLHALTLHASYRFEQRKSNDTQFQYNDKIALISASWRF